MAVRHACVRTEGDGDLAADLVQDTFEAAAVAWAALREDPSRPAAGLAARHAGAQGHQRTAAQGGVRRRQPEIHARYQATPADTEAEALNAIGAGRARQVIDGMRPR